MQFVYWYFLPLGQIPCLFITYTVRTVLLYTISANLPRKFWQTIYTLFSVVEPKLFLKKFGSGSYFFTLISDPDSNQDQDPACLLKIHKKCRSSKHRKKGGLFRKNHFNCRFSKQWKKDIEKKSVHFYSFIFISWKQNLTWIQIRIRSQNRIRN